MSKITQYGEVVISDKNILITHFVYDGGKGNRDDFEIAALTWAQKKINNSIIEATKRQSIKE